jgi:hypothetical protein
MNHTEMQVPGQGPFKVMIFRILQLSLNIVLPCGKLLLVSDVPIHELLFVTRAREKAIIRMDVS